MASEDASIEDSILQCSHLNRYMVFLPSEGYTFAGSFRFQCLFGDVNVGGYTMKGTSFSETNFVQFTVHNKAQVPMAFTPLPMDDNISNEELLFHRLRAVMEGSIEDFKCFSQCSAAILLDVDPTPADAYLTSRIGEYRKPLEKFKCYKLAGECYIVQGLRWTDEILPIPPHIQSPELIQDVVNYVLKNGSSLMVTGNKGVGKSTLVRYIVNRFLSSDSKVYLLDTDIGQTEFTPPGCVSLFKVDTPILTPPFLHQQMNFPSTFCIGSLSPSGDNYQTYIECVRRLVREFKDVTDRRKILVVNTHGWVEDFGSKIMRQLIQTIQPTTMLNILSQMVANFDIPQLSFKQHHYQYFADERSRINLSTSREISAKTWREYALIGYFANCLNDPCFGTPSPERSLASLLSYQVKFDKILLYFHRDREKVAENYTFSALNCSLVALCGFTNPLDKDEIRTKHVCDDPRWPKLMEPKDPKRNMVLRCYGFGIIRGISPERRLFYLITPITTAACAKVEILFVPDRIKMPDYILDRDDPNAPYMVEFKSKEEYDRAVQNRNKCLLALSQKHINVTAFRNIQRVTNAAAARSTSATAGYTNRRRGADTRATSDAAGPPNKRPHTNQ